VARYADVLNDIMSIFGTVEWIAENIATFPNNNRGVSTEYIRVTPILGNEPLNRKSHSGVLNIDIFITAGEGPKRAFQIADSLDSYIQNKTIALSAGSTQFGVSNLVSYGLDRDNTSLYRYVYSINFNYFGVL